MFAVRYSHAAAKAMRKLDPKLRGQIPAAVAVLAENPQAPHLDVKPLKGRLAGIHRLRVRDWHVLFIIDGGELTILVLDVRPRGEAYDA